MGRECFESLPEMELHQIYELHQQDLIARCKKNFQELLLEKADLFYQFRSSPAGTVTQDDILDITDNLAEDGRYKALDRMDADRKLLLFQVQKYCIFVSSQFLYWLDQIASIFCEHILCYFVLLFTHLFCCLKKSICSCLPKASQICFQFHFLL